ncbi:MAG: ABC transporter permease subunit [Proteobacteria bacterium]|nr:ABC transporter permease subunit [Pseudomonadota bacterium]
MSRAGLLRLLVIVLLIGGVEFLCRIGIVDRFTMIPPSEMVASLVRLVGTADWFWPDVTYTLRNIIVATCMSVVGGFLAGLAVHALPRLRRVLDPLFSSYYSVPTFVLYPLLIVVFGIGPLSLIVMGAMFGIVAMIVATLNAIDRVPRVLLKVARVARMGSVSTALRLKLPAAAPHLFTGLKLGVAYSVIGVVAGEFILATEGIGRRIAYSYNNFDNATMYGMLVLILMLVAVANSLLQGWERRLHRRWYRR